MDFTIEKILWQLINLAMVLLLLAATAWVFMDARKRKKSIIDALLWAFITLFLFPPVGFFLYFFSGRKRINGG